MIKSMATVSSIGLMGDVTVGIGLMENSMGEASIEAAMALSGKVNGMMGRNLNGSTSEMRCIFITKNNLIVICYRHILFNPLI
jgi:hypothetical protein